MDRKLVMAAVFAVGVVGFVGSATAQLPGGGQAKTITKKLKFIYMDPQGINVEGWYDGSEHTGGGLMKCMARWECSDGTSTWTENENVSADAEWSIEFENIYFLEEGVTLFDDGLWVNPYFVDVVDGYTGVTAHYEGMRADGSITVCDYRE